MDLDAVCERIDYHGSRTPSLALLQALCKAFLTTVPFENLDIHLGRPIRLTPQALFDKIVAARRGGFCYEINGFFALVLRQLGFVVDLLSARVLDDDRPGPEFDHLTLRVHWEGQWLVDVGFGEFCRRPLAWIENRDQEDGEGTFRLAAVGDGWKIQRVGPSGGHMPGYLFGTRTRTLDEFEDMCRYHQSSPQSKFTRSRICTRLTAKGRISLDDSGLITSEAGMRSVHPVQDSAEYLRILDTCFGIDLGTSVHWVRPQVVYAPE